MAFILRLNDFQAVTPAACHVALSGKVTGLAEVYRAALTQRLTRMETNGCIPQSGRQRLATPRCENVAVGCPSAVRGAASLTSVRHLLSKKKADVPAQVPDYWGRSNK